MFLLARSIQVDSIRQFELVKSNNNAIKLLLNQIDVEEVKEAKIIIVPEGIKF